MTVVMVKITCEAFARQWGAGKLVGSGERAVGTREGDG